jgi:pre ATP-grasp domain-containing protein/pheganomycin biosynthesis PGM1-like protein
VAKLIVANWSFEQELDNLSPDVRRVIGYQSQRMVWFAGAGDVLVLPTAPDEAILSYMTGLLGIRRSSIQVIVPPPGKLGGDVLTRDRLENETLLAQLRRLVTERGVDRAEALSFDGSVNGLVDSLGLAEGTPGLRFMEQGGAELLNSKATFRAIASGIGVPVPDGIVTDLAEDALAYVWSLVSRGESAMVKQDVQTGGFGNEVLSPAGAGTAVESMYQEWFTDRDQVARHIAKRWFWYTSGSRRRVVIEHYRPDSASIWAEVSVTDDAATVVGDGIVRLKPILNGSILPIPAGTAPAAEFDRFVVDAKRIGEVMRAMGYRGMTNIDAIVTPDGEVLFNEINARLGGCSHMYRIGERLVGRDYLATHHLIGRRRVPFPTLDATVAKLAGSGLGYDTHTRSGIVLSTFGINGDGTGGECCIVAESLDTANRMERAMLELFP